MQETRKQIDIRHDAHARQWGHLCVGILNLRNEGLFISPTSKTLPLVCSPLRKSRQLLPQHPCFHGPKLASTLHRTKSVVKGTVRSNLPWRMYR
jgi:hypothetical protein